METYSEYKDLKNLIEYFEGASIAARLTRCWHAYLIGVCHSKRPSPPVTYGDRLLDVSYALGIKDGASEGEDYYPVDHVFYETLKLELESYKETFEMCEEAESWEPDDDDE